MFKYLAINDKLEENVINKLILYEKKKEFYRNILIDVVEKLSSFRKEKIFKSIIKKIDFNNNIEDIEYLLKLIEACLIEKKSNKNNFKQMRKKIKKMKNMKKVIKLD